MNPHNVRKNQEFRTDTKIKLDKVRPHPNSNAPDLINKTRRPKVRNTKDLKCLLIIREDEETGENVYCNTDHDTKQDLKAHMERHNHESEWHC